jgi:hypothetical protein
MRRFLYGLCCLSAMQVVVAGCASNEPMLKPKPRPEELNVPPDDARYNNYISYPKGVLNADAIKRDQDKTQDGPPVGIGRSPGFSSGSRGGY